jgi:inner membrane protein
LLKTIFVVDPLYTIPLVIALIMVWKTKDATSQKYITKGLFISSFICFYLVAVKLYALHQFEKALNKQESIILRLL